MTEDLKSKTLEELLAEADDLIRKFDVEFIKSLEDGPRRTYEKNVSKIKELKQRSQNRDGEKDEGTSYGEGIHEAVLDIVKAMKDLSKYFS